MKSINSTIGCTVNVVVVHPSPDQREGILRAAFTYTGYGPPEENITLFVSKCSPMGTFENNGANWRWITPNGLWNIIDDEYTCIPRPYPSGIKAMYYGNKYQCNYDNGAKNNGDMFMPFITVDRADAVMRFKYYRDVEYNTLRNADVFKIVLDVPYIIKKTIFLLDSTVPSEQEWVQSPDLPLGEAAGYQARIHFMFDTVDNIDNNHRGIAIDDVELVGAHWSGWAEMSGEVILNWTGGLPKYFIYRGKLPYFVDNLPELRAYTPFMYKYENTLNDDESYYYVVK